jgi:hypothetical protein
MESKSLPKITKGSSNLLSLPQPVQGFAETSSKFNKKATNLFNLALNTQQSTKSSQKRHKTPLAVGKKN